MRPKPPPYNVADWHREFGHNDPVTQEYVPTPPPEEDVPLWRAWFTAFAVDPDSVILTYWVERRPAPFAVVWLEDFTDGEVTYPVERSIELQELPPPFPDTPEGEAWLIEHGWLEP